MIYVDTLHDYGWVYGASCHMSTDDHSTEGLELLHKMAVSIGLRRRYFQDKPTCPHYDLTASKRALAVKAGAIEVSGREFVRKCGRKHVKAYLNR